MPATMIKLGSPPPTFGGDAELEVVSRLVEKLSERYVIVSSLSLPTRSGDFREYDIIIVTAALCGSLQVKSPAGPIVVYEDRIRNDGRLLF